MSHRVWGGTGSLPYGGLGALSSRPHSPGVRLSLRGPLNKKRRCCCNGVEYVVEVRRVDPYALRASGPLARLPPRSGCSAYGRATGTSASRPHSPGVRLSLRGPLNKKRRCCCNGVEYVVEVRRVELLSTTANREVSPGSVGSQNGERSVKRQTSRTPAGSILACGIPATSASAIPLNDLAPAPGIERRIEGAELN